MYQSGLLRRTYPASSRVIIKTNERILKKGADAFPEEGAVTKVHKLLLGYKSMSVESKLKSLLTRTAVSGQKRRLGV